MEAFRIPSPTEGLPSSGWLPANKLPRLKDQSNHHPLATGIKRLPWHAADGLIAPDLSNQTHVKRKPKMPRAQVGTALQNFLAQQASLQAPKALSKELDQEASIASSDPANIEANVPAAPLFARRNIGLPGACKPAAQTKALAIKQAAGTSAKKPPLPAKRPLPGSAQQAKKAASDKRPKAAQQKPMPASADLMEDLAGQNLVRSSLPATGQTAQAEAPPVIPPALLGDTFAGKEPNGRLASMPVLPAHAADDLVSETAAPRKRTQMADVDAAAVEVKVTSLRAEGKLSSLTVPELKTWLKARKLAVGGKKADLLSRLEGAAGPS